MGVRSSQPRSPNLNKTDGHLLEYLRDTFVQGGGADTRVATGLVATGGVINDYSSGSKVYRAHVFTSSGIFNVTELGSYPASVEYLVVAGGGGGGYSQGGGGGAGGVRTNLAGHPLATGNPAFPVSATSYPVTIGAGGVGGSPSPYAGIPGGDSVLTHPDSNYTITALRGGGGGSHDDVSAVSGGSGGGAGRRNASKAGASGSFSGSPANPTPGYRQGYPGGTAQPGYSAPYCGAGGGGAGGAAATVENDGIGTGGAGVQVLIAGPPTHTGVGATGPSSPTGQWFAGGGGGGSNVPQPDVPAGGGGAPPGNSLSGGGIGGGGTAPNAIGGQVMAGTGGGGGGGSHPISSYPGGQGGSGICIIRYQIAELEQTAKATGGSISFYNGKTIHTFTSSGTFVNPASIDNVEVVMVAGGGSGGLNIAGGGGAGAVLESPSSGFTFPNNTYTITIGGGSAGQSSTGPATANTANDTTITYPGPYTWTAQRGGYGGSYPDVGAQPGGSGGGAAPDPSSNSGGTKTAADAPTPIGTLTAYGNAGGTAGGHSYQGGGGGGAGAAGENAPGPGVGGDGGVGRQLPTTFRDPRQAPSDSSNPQPYQRGGGIGTPGPSPGGFYVAAGGGGAAYSANTPANRGLGGSGGGGDGGYSTQSPPATDGQNALESTGSGGGGAGYSPSTKSTAGSGGSGIVLIAYPT